MDERDMRWLSITVAQGRESAKKEGVLCPPQCQPESPGQVQFLLWCPPGVSPNLQYQLKITPLLQSLPWIFLGIWSFPKISTKLPEDRNNTSPLYIPSVSPVTRTAPCTLSVLNNAYWACLLALPWLWSSDTLSPVKIKTAYTPALHQAPILSGSLCSEPTQSLLMKWVWVWIKSDLCLGTEDAHSSATPW